MGNPTQQVLVMYAMLGLVLIYLAKNLYLGFFVWRQNAFVFGLMARLSERLLTIYLRQPYRFHLQRNSAQLIRNALSEVDVIAGNCVTPLMTLLTEFFVVFCLSALLLYIEPIGVLVVASILATVSWAFSRFTHPSIKRWGTLRQHHSGLRIQHLQQGLGSVKDIKLLGREAEFIGQFRTHNQLYARVASLQNTLVQFPRLWLEILAIGGLAILVFAMVKQGSDLRAILPTLALFAAAAFRLMPSVTRILGALHLLQYGLPAASTLSAELKLPAPATDEQGGSAVTFSESLALHNVTYRYEGAPVPALQKLTLSVRRGETVGFIGASGAGKSTLVDILLGLLTPDAGEVRVDGADIQSSLRNWQNRIGYVPQFIYLTDDTLRRNVAFGLSENQIDESSVQRAIQAAQLDEFIRSLPDGLETMVGERGARLSGGQRQRIGIARALYHDPEVLVLDEATSALDITTERGVMGAVKALQGTKTIFIVAHRLSTVEHCDLIFRLENGRVVARGKAKDVLAQSGDSRLGFE